MLHAAGAWTRDPDHSGALRRRAVSGPLANGAPIPGALGDARADGHGGVLSTPQSRAAALDRVRAAIDAAMDGALPMATAAGDLPAGIHQASWGAVAARFSHGERRSDLTRQLGVALGSMHAAGVEQVVVGGSYVGSKPRPGDVDLVVVPRADGAMVDLGAIKRSLRELAPDVHAYAAASIVTNATTLPGATPGENFLEFFQHSRTGAARGAVLLRPQPATTGGLASALGGVARLLGR